MQQEYVPLSWDAGRGGDQSSDSFLSLHSTDRGVSHSFTFEAIRPCLFRTTFTTNDHPLPPHGSASKPHTDLRDFMPTSVSTALRKEITIGNVTASIEWSTTPLVSLSFVDGVPLHKDLPFRSYAIDGKGVSHYTVYNKGTLHAGLGEKPAPMDLSNQSFTLSATDSFGYDIYRTDPLYKNIPLLINATPDGCVATFSTSHSRGFYSVGAEMDGMWGPYKVYRQAYGGLEEYLIIGTTIQDIVKTYAELVGYPLLVPRWAFGYIAGGMKYSMLDEPRASEALIELAGKLKQYDIPCSGFQLSSGYTVAEKEPKTRNVFTWNRHRFPDPKGFVDAYHRAGIRLIANVKPYVLCNHPEYQILADSGAFFVDPETETTATTRLWSAGGGESGVGSHIDFTSAAGFRWWYEGVRGLKELGIDCIWNDNDEYTVSTDNWECALDEHSLRNSNKIESRNIGLWGRALQTELNGKSSHDALVDAEPDVRPFVLTRSATAGTMRYAASSWSGDNVTSWESMKGSGALSLTAGMCLLQCYGHDIGGFEGPQPSPELLLRWVQLGVYSSRFAINCFKTSAADNNVGDVIEPWMYPEITPLIRKALKRRYEMIPYLYSLHLDSHLNARPPQRWTGWGYENDPEVWCKHLKSGETQFWLGDVLLVGGVFEPGTDIAKLYLPRCSAEDPGFLNLSPPYEYLEAGQWVDIKSEWKTSIPVLARVGSAIPVGKSVQTLSPGEKKNEASLPLDDYRAVEIFPPAEDESRFLGKTFTTSWYEDDGISATTRVSKFSFTFACSLEKKINIDFERDVSSGFVPPWKALHVKLPVGDDRAVVSGKHKIEDAGKDGSGRRVFLVEFNLMDKRMNRL
jgi:alpha-glucosidase (family GH31 glycosyl hydrolase)